MTARLFAASLGLAAALGLGLSTVATAQDKEGAPKPAETTKDAPKPADDAATTKPATPKVPRVEKATFGGGCFWCTEAVFERVPGVKSVVSGYAGGTVPNPTYEMVSTDQTGHAEVVQLEFDPDTVSYETLVNIFFTKAHDPTTLNAQGPDHGTRYRSIILYHSEDQRVAARKVYAEIKAKNPRARIVTELVPMTPFYPAEPYHQDYYRFNPNAPYSRAYIAPKVRKMTAPK